MILLLNNTYEPLGIIGWRKAITLIYSGKAEILEESNKVIKSQKISMKLPEVVRLLHYVKYKRKNGTKFTRHNLYSRDSYTCQYCYEIFPYDELTFDHVIPVKHGGQTTWDNIVTACRECNFKKDDRIPEEAGMELLNHPKHPAWSPVINIMVEVKRPPENWKGYLYQKCHH